MNVPKILVHFENENIVAVDKPSGWLSVPSRQGQSDQRFCVGKLLELQLNQRLFPVHRLDEPVSGLLLFAKTPQAQSAMNTWFEKRFVKKRYEAITAAEFQLWKWGSSSWEVNLIPDVKQTWACALAKGKRRAFLDEKIGKIAITEAFFRKKLNPSTLLWDLFPLTGRSHQLRVHLAMGGYPIAGDVLYGSTRPTDNPFLNVSSPNLPQLQAISLRSCELNFEACFDAPSFGLPSFFRIEGNWQVS